MKQYNPGNAVPNDPLSGMLPTFQSIIKSSYVDENPFRILIYNGLLVVGLSFFGIRFLGDTDLACSFLEAELFIENLKEVEKATVYYLLRILIKDSIMRNHYSM